MDEQNRPVYCPRCGSIAQAGDRFCGVCGERITSDAPDAVPTEEIPTQVYPPPNVPVRRGNRTLTVILGLGAVFAIVLAVGAIVSLNLLGRETASQDGAQPEPPKGEQNNQGTLEQDQGSESLSVGDSVEIRGIKTTLNDVRTLPTTDLDQPLESPDNLFVATDLTFENTSDENVAGSSLYTFLLKDEGGYSASQTTHTQQRPLAEANIAPGEKNSGEIVYEVPPESKGLQLDYSPFSGDKTYTWQIGDASQIPGSSAQTPSATGQTEEDLIEAVEDYYQAVDREDWGYTYENLDSKTQAMFTKEEWYLKNQWFADTEGLELATMDVSVNGTTSDPLVSVTVYRTFKDGTSIDRDTLFVFEDGTWKHRFSEEEIGFFMPEASFEEFVAAQGGSSPSPSASAAPAGDEAAEVEDAVRSHYEAIGEGDFEEAYSYFGPTMRSRQDEASWIASEQSFEIQSSTIHSLTVDKILGSTATATVDVSFVDNAGNPRFLIVWGLVKEDGQWKLDEQISAQRASNSSASPSPSPSASTPASGDIDCDQVNGPVRVPPGDPNNLDADGDGWGCEQ